MAKGESACQPWSWLQREEMGGSAQSRKSLTGHHCSASGTWTLKADLDWEGLFTQWGLLQQGHRNQPTNICMSYMFLDQQLEGGAWTAFPLGDSFGNTTENKSCTGIYPGSTQIISQINCHHPDMKEGKRRFTAEHNHQKDRAVQQLQEGTPSRLHEFTFKNTEKMCRGMFYKAELVI